MQHSRRNKWIVSTLAAALLVALSTDSSLGYVYEGGYAVYDNSIPPELIGDFQITGGTYSATVYEESYVGVIVQQYPGKSTELAEDHSGVWNVWCDPFPPWSVSAPWAVTSTFIRQ